MVTVLKEQGWHVFKSAIPSCMCCYSYLALQCPIWQPLATCGYLNLSQLQLNKIKIQFLSHINHFSSASWLHMASGYSIGQHKYRMFPSLQKVLLDSTALDLLPRLIFICIYISNSYNFNVFATWSGSPLLYMQEGNDGCW